MAIVGKAFKKKLKKGVKRVARTQGRVATTVGKISRSYGKVADEGVANWEDAIKNQFELIEEKQVVMIHATDGKKVEMSKPDSERPPDSRTYKNDQVLNDEEAVYSIGEYIKKKRNLYNIDLPAFVGKTWWK